jgi:hypothetical protein
MYIVMKANPLEGSKDLGTPDPHQEVRCAVRFPLALPILLAMDGREVPALTRNVSASGVLFELDEPIKSGISIHFQLRMPGPILGVPNDVLVHCAGRVVRCSIGQRQHFAAATIDEYRFAEH